MCRCKIGQTKVLCVMMQIFKRGTPQMILVCKNKVLEVFLASLGKASVSFTLIGLCRSVP